MSSKIQDRMLGLAAQCVRCGMCLPHCPTTQLHNIEGQSPRGRIALWQNLAQNTLELTQSTHKYLTECLSCGACANNCPAGVKFLELQDLGKQFLHESTKAKNTSVQTRLLISVFSKNSLTRLLHYGLYFYQKLKLHNIVKLALKPLPKFRQQINTLYDMLPKLTVPVKYQPLYKTNRPNKSQNVILFTGCVNKLSSHNKIIAAIDLLNKLGINVHVLNNLHCCGAMYQHNGFADQYKAVCTNNQETVTKFLNSAIAVAAQNENAAVSRTKAQRRSEILSLIDPEAARCWDRDDSSVITTLESDLDGDSVISHLLTIDTGCHPTLQQQFNKFKNIKTQNIEHFIYEHIKSYNIDISNKINKAAILARTIYFYTPCSQREQLKTPNITQDLLRLVLSSQTNYNVKQMPMGYGCCGAAGSYMIDHPDTANKFTKKIIDDFLLQNPALANQRHYGDPAPIICTSNVGCSLQIKKILFETYGIKIDILHPIEIINDLLNQSAIDSR